MENLDALLHGFTIALSWQHLALMVVGVLLGILVGVLPGLGAPNGVSLLLPLTFGMDAGLGHHPALEHVLGRAVRRLRRRRSCSTSRASRPRSRRPSTAIRWPSRAAEHGAGDRLRLGRLRRARRRRPHHAARRRWVAKFALRLRPAGVFRGLFPRLRELHRHGRRAADEDAGLARASASPSRRSASTRCRAACA